MTPLSPSAVNESANISASFFHYMQDGIPEEDFFFDEPLEPILATMEKSAAISIKETPLPTITLLGGFGGDLSAAGDQGQWEETQFEFDVVVDQQKETNAPLRLRQMVGKIRTLLRDAGRMDDTGPAEQQIKPPIFVRNYAVDKNPTAIVGQIFIPWYVDGWWQPTHETDPTVPTLKRSGFLVRARYFNRFDQQYTPATLKPA